MPSLLESFREKLEGANRDQLMDASARLLCLLKERVESDPLLAFTPHPKQLAFFQSQARERWIIASNRFGKTTCGAAEASYRSLARHPYLKVPLASQGWVVSLDYKMQRDIIQPKLIQWIPRERIAHVSYREQETWDRLVLICNRCSASPKAKPGRAKEIGSEVWWCPNCQDVTPAIVFKSCDQGRKKFQGTALDWIWFDEEPDEDIYDECRMRLVDRKGVIWGTMTPVNGMSFTYDRVANAPKEAGIEVFGGSMYDNPSLDQDEVRRTEASIDDAGMRDIRIYGKYAVLTGLIYRMYDASVHEKSLDVFRQLFCDERDAIFPDFDIYCGIDTGRCFAAEFALVDYFANAWFFDEHYAEDQSIASNARALHAICRKWGVWPSFVLDASSQFDLDLGEHGIPCTKTRDPVDLGIQLMIQYMRAHAEPQGGPRFYIVAENCPRWLYERRRYQWDKPARVGASAGQPKNKPKKVDDHALDGSRYIVQLRPPASEANPDRKDNSIELKIREHVRQKVSAREEARESEGWQEGSEW